MKNNLPPAAIGGILAAVVALAAAGLFLGLRDKPPTREINKAAAAEQGPPPADKPMPDWAMEKLRSAENAQK